MKQVLFVEFSLFTMCKFKLQKEKKLVKWMEICPLEV